MKKDQKKKPKEEKQLEGYQWDFLKQSWEPVYYKDGKEVKKEKINN